MSRAGSSRWSPTPEQLMILEELYRSGIRTPSASQIQHITTHLCFYGRIEGKNVFYWFQNHKARDRQKLRRKLNMQHHLQQQQQHYLLGAFDSSHVLLSQVINVHSYFVTPFFSFSFSFKPPLCFVDWEFWDKWHISWKRITCVWYKLLKLVKYR